MFELMWFAIGAVTVGTFLGVRMNELREELRAVRETATYTPIQQVTPGSMTINVQYDLSDDALREADPALYEAVRRNILAQSKIAGLIVT